MATVKEIWTPSEFNDEGKVIREQKVFGVYDGENLVGRFFPTIETEKEIKARAESFAKNFKVVEIEKENFITRDVKEDNDNNSNTKKSPKKSTKNKK